MAFRIFIALLVITAGYLSFEIYRYHSFYSDIRDAPSYQVRGPKNAKIKIVKFIDYNCNVCQVLEDISKEALNGRNDVREIIRPFPITGDSAEKITRLALAAGHQGKFWELHNELLKFPDGDLTDNDIHLAVQKAGLDYDKLSTAAQSEAVEKDFRNNIETAFKLGIKEIPSFLINRTIFVPKNGMPGTKEFLQIVETAAK